MICLWMLLSLSWLSTSLTANDLTVKVPVDVGKNGVVVHKCCGDEELMNYQHHCMHVNATDSQPWAPIFSDDRGRHNIQTGENFFYK